MRVLILGGGGREHALAWAVAKSPRLDALFCAPGNAGIAAVATCVALDIENADAVADWAAEARIDLVIVGPEAPLAAGVADALRHRDIPVFGPSAAAAQLESSKTFTKEICDACGAPTAAWQAFDAVAPALAYLADRPVPIVIKADGLAAGKGVVVAETREMATDAVHAALADGGSIVIEDFLAGEEASLFVLVDGETVVALASAQDHKRAFEGDQGPNTGGMGAYSPAPVMTPEVEAAAIERIVRPTLAEMAARGMPYQGVLFAGLMIEDGTPRLVEYNVRFGDPECQVILMRLESDLLEALDATARGTLGTVALAWSNDAAMTVVAASRGYPGTYRKGTEIRGADTAEATEGVTVFHAGTARDGERLLANGGRVLNVTARGASLATARDRAYAALDKLDWPDGFWRGDIGWRALDPKG